MKLKKIIILIISILVPLIGTTMIGVYSYKRYDPEVYTDIQEEFKNSLSEGVITTDKRIEVYRYLENYYLKTEPIYEKDITLNGEKVAKILIFQNLCIYKDETTKEELLKSKYEMFVCDINYTAIQKEFEKYYDDKTIVYGSTDPQFMVNFYPTDEYNEDEALLTKATDYTLSTSYATVSLYDYKSTPTKKGENPYFVQMNYFREYNFDSKILDLFNDGKAYIEVTCKIERNITEDSTTVTYTKELEDYLLKDEITNFELNGSEIDEKTLEKGWRDPSVRETLANAGVGYNKWLFKHYLWWQILIAFVILSAIMVGFYFAFTYEGEETKPMKKSTKKK